MQGKADTDAMLWLLPASPPAAPRSAGGAGWYGCEAAVYWCRKRFDMGLFCELVGKKLAVWFQS